MIVSINGKLDKINFAPSTIQEEIMQNIKTILTTYKYDVPLDRNFGIRADGLDEPIPVAMAKTSADIVEAILEYEPRANVKQVFFEGDDDGKLIPTVRIEL